MTSINVHLTNHTVVLGPRALSFVETMRGKRDYLNRYATMYAQDQLVLWLNGGRVDADVTIVPHNKDQAVYPVTGYTETPKNEVTRD